MIAFFKNFICHFALGFILQFVGGDLKISSAVCITVEVTQMEMCHFGYGDEIDIVDTCLDLGADALGIWAGKSFRELLIGEGDD